MSVTEKLEKVAPTATGWLLCVEELVVVAAFTTGVGREGDAFSGIVRVEKFSGRGVDIP